MNLLKEGIEKGIAIKTDSTFRVFLNGEQVILPVYKINISQLFFNDKNDRIATFINKYKSENNIQEFNRTNLQEYNDILHKFIIESNEQAFKSTKKNIELIGQSKDAIVLKDGRIIDGNRRFTCLRELSKTNSKFEYLHAAILEQSIENNAREIKMLELAIQQGEDEKIPYDPIDRLVGIYNDIEKNKLLSIQEYARSVNKKINKIEEEVEISKLMVSYLDFIGEKEKFYIAREFKIDGPIREIYKILKKIDDPEIKQSSMFFYFALLSIKTNGDFTREIRDIGKLAKDSELFYNCIEENDYNVQKLMDIYNDKTKKIEEKLTSASSSQESMNIKKSVDLVVNKINSKLSKNEPINQLMKAFDTIEAIDTNIFIKQSKEERKSVEKIICKIEEACEHLKDKLGCLEN